MATNNAEAMVKTAVSLGQKYSEMTDRIITRLCGYSPVQVKVLCLMYKNNGSILQKEIESHFSFSRPAISQLVDQMESNGLITRTDVENDKRKKLIKMTPAGAEIAKKVTGELGRFYRKMGENLSSDELRNASEIFRKLIKILEINGDQTTF